MHGESEWFETLEDGFGGKLKKHPWNGNKLKN
jgi:hypothetical protein